MIRKWQNISVPKEYLARLQRRTVALICNRVNMICTKNITFKFGALEPFIVKSHWSQNFGHSSLSCNGLITSIWCQCTTWCICYTCNFNINSGKYFSSSFSYVLHDSLSHTKHVHWIRRSDNSQIIITSCLLHHPGMNGTDWMLWCIYCEDLSMPHAQAFAKNLPMHVMGVVLVIAL